jgi:glycosyltransferase involved in cell wall biosynthesis
MLLQFAYGSEKLKVSILICTYNRGSLIDGTLESIIKDQSQKPDEIVVVNGGGENDCNRTLDKWKIFFPSLIIFETKNKNLAVSRNIGLPICSGDLILQTDDDARPFPDWIQKMAIFHKKYPKVGVLGGNVIDASGHSYLSRIADIATFPHHDKMTQVRSLAGVNSSYKKEVIQQVGEYDETLFRGEDVDYNWRAIQKGWDVLFIPEIKVKHLHRPTWRGLIYQHYMYGRAHFMVRNKWDNMYSHYPLQINSIVSLLKWSASWTWIPLQDATQKAKKMNSLCNGFDIITFWIINLVNRIGSSVQRIQSIA